MNEILLNLHVNLHVNFQCSDTCIIQNIITIRSILLCTYFHIHMLCVYIIHKV